MHLRSLLQGAASLVAVAVISSPAFSQLLLDDFSSGTDNLWIQTDLVAGAGIGSTTYNASSGAYVITTTALPPLPVVAASGSLFLASFGVPGAFSEGIFHASVTVNNPATNAILSIRTDAQNNGYAFALNNLEDRIYISRLDQGVQGAAAFQPFIITENTKYEVEGVAHGSEFELRVWVAPAPRPDLPLVTFSDSNYALGAIGLVVYSQSTNGNPPGNGGSLQATFDDVTLIQCGNASSYGTGCPGSNGLVPALSMDGCLLPGVATQIDLVNALPSSSFLFVVGTQQATVPIGGGCPLHVGGPALIVTGLIPTGTGSVSIPTTIPAGIIGIAVTVQALVVDPTTPLGAAASTGLLINL